MDVPERIWMRPFEYLGKQGSWMAPMSEGQRLSDGDGTEYVRVDFYDALTAERDALREALKPFAFLGEETTQEAWEMRYKERFQDWIDFDDMETARKAMLAEREK